MSRRILLLITDLEIGGTPTVVRELAIRLNDPPGVVVEVACLKGWGPVADQLRDAGVRVTELRARGVSDFLRTLIRLVKLIHAGNYDTVFSFLVHANLLAAAASVVCRGVRFVESIQTTQPEPALYWRLQEYAAFGAERIVVPSSSVARVANESSGISFDKITVIPNAIDPTTFQPSTVPSTDPRPFPVGFIGRLDPIKRIPDLLAAVKMLDGLVELHVFGAGAERVHIEQEIARLGIGDRAFLRGAIASPQQALAEIGLLVLPSQAEGFGLVLIEAMAAAVPVVATNAPGICDVVRDGQTGLLVPVGSPTDLANAIRRLVQDRGLRRALVAAGRADVEARFTWDAVLPQYRRLLEL